MHRLGSPYGHCTKGVEGVDVQLLYNASYTLQVSPRPWPGGREHLGRDRGSQGRGCSGEGGLESGRGNQGRFGGGPRGVVSEEGPRGSGGQGGGEWERVQGGQMRC